MARSTTTIPKSRRRTVTAGTAPTYAADHPLQVALNVLASHHDEAARLENLTTTSLAISNEERLAAEATDAGMRQALLNYQPHHPDHIATMLLLAERYAGLSDFVGTDGKLAYNNPTEARTRLLMLRRVIERVVHAMCLHGASLHKVAQHWTTEADWAAFQNAADIGQSRR
jgi:hypothetical protein